jgi:hypothetical protein
MPKTPKKQVLSLQGFDASHIQQTEQYTKAIDALYNQAVAEYAQMAGRLTVDPSKPFSFGDYPGTKAKADAIVRSLSDKMQTVIMQGSEKQWLFANKKNDAFLDSILDTSLIKKSILSKYQDQNLNALKTFQTRKINGLGLSDRIFNYSGQMKTQMELGIDLALGDGKSAQALARDLKQYLVDPDKLFRRVRDKHGMLQLSKNAEAFHPGRGKYRSSHKNAMRLTRTEINIAYRESDQLRWKSLDFVIGFEVKLSNNHPVPDICDVVKGKYPKDFKFVGWHPQCRCISIPILQDPKDFNTNELAELKAAINGTEYKPMQSANTITDVPKGFKDWITENAERSQGWKSQPYFIKNNFKGGKISGGLDMTTSPVVQQVAEKVVTVVTKEAVKVIVSNIPSELAVGSDYLKGTNIEFKEEFFALLDKNKPVRLRFSNTDKSYRSGDIVQIGTGPRSVRSKNFKERIIYHEYGHAIDDHRGLRYSEGIKNLMDKYKKSFSKKRAFTFSVQEYDYTLRSVKYVRKTANVSELGAISSRLDNIYRKIQRMPDATFTKRGIMKHDILENICSTMDTIMSLNPNYGWGHTKSYFKNYGMKEAEFIAHAFENTFCGNPIFKKYMPDLYDDMILYIKDLK